MTAFVTDGLSAGSSGVYHKKKNKMLLLYRSHLDILFYIVLCVCETVLKLGRS